MDDCKAVLVSQPGLTYDITGEVYALPVDIVHTVYHFTVPDGYRSEGSCELSFIYSIGLYLVP